MYSRAEVILGWAVILACLCIVVTLFWVVGHFVIKFW